METEAITMLKELIAKATVQQELGAFEDPMAYLEKASFFALSFGLMYILYAIVAYTGHRTISRNLDEAENIIEKAKGDTLVETAPARYELAGKVLMAHTIRVSVMSVMSGLLSMGL